MSELPVVFHMSSSCTYVKLYDESIYSEMPPSLQEQIKGLASPIYGDLGFHVTNRRYIYL